MRWRVSSVLFSLYIEGKAKVFKLKCVILKKQINIYEIFYSNYNYDLKSI